MWLGTPYNLISNPYHRLELLTILDKCNWDFCWLHLYLCVESPSPILPYTSDFCTGVTLMKHSCISSQFQNILTHSCTMNLSLQTVILLSCLSDEIIYLFISWPRNSLDCIMNWMDFPGSAVKNLPASMRCRFHPWVGKTPWRRKWQPTLVFLPGESHGWRSLVGTAHGVARSHTHMWTEHHSLLQAFQIWC